MTDQPASPPAGRPVTPAKMPSHAEDGRAYPVPPFMCDDCDARAITLEPRPLCQIHEERMLQWFSFEHLHADVQGASQPFRDVAWFIVRKVPPGAERTAGLRKLLESKDCIVRAAMANLAALRR